jgi:thymidylate synthase (FAD)
MDSLFKVEVISRQPYPQSVIWAAMHQDYSEGFVSDEMLREGNSLLPKSFTEDECGNLVVKHLLAGNRGHFGPIEHPQIVLNCGWFPHSVMQQIRTHRVGISFDVQSGRYTGKRICDLVSSIGMLDLGCLQDVEAIEEVFYLRPLGEYSDRQGKKYEYTEDWRNEDIEECWRAAVRFQRKIDEGFSEEHARSMIPFDIRQNWVMSCNVRSLMHLLDLRAKSDAQLECQQLCELIWPHFEAWVPEIADWYKKNRWGKARLSP